MLGKSFEEDRENITFIHQKLPKRDRLLVVTRGKNPVIISKWNYEEGKFSVYTETEVGLVPKEEIVDTNGCGDSFVGGFMSEFMKGSDLAQCVKAGNYAASVVIRHIGCTYSDRPNFK